MHPIKKQVPEIIKETNSSLEESRIKAGSVVRSGQKESEDELSYSVINES